MKLKEGIHLYLNAGVGIHHTRTNEVVGRLIKFNTEQLVVRTHKLDDFLLEEIKPILKPLPKFEELPEEIKDEFTEYEEDSYLDGLSIFKDITDLQFRTIMLLIQAKYDLFFWIESGEAISNDELNVY